MRVSASLNSPRTYLTPVLVLWSWLATPAAAHAQEHQHGPPALPGWSITIAAQAFLNTNLQGRKFTDFYQFESQNWFMADVLHTAGLHRFGTHLMLSLEPFTLRRLGSAQVFQTGETLDGAPLIDYQHPHDLIMALEGVYEWTPHEGTRLRVSGGPVGSAALGPPPTMHRASAAGNPTMPLAHHQLDSTHIARSVVTAGGWRGALGLEASMFKGREPDEDRVGLDVGMPDSWSARVSWSQDSWYVQASGGHLKQPEPNEPFDVTRVTASAGFAGRAWSGDLNVTIAAGRNVEFYGNMDAWLAEASWRRARHAVHVRVESVEKNILTAGGLHPPGSTHPHITSRVGAATIGYAIRVADTQAGTFSPGADVTLHAVPMNLRDSYGDRPVSFHVYVHWTVGRH